MADLVPITPGRSQGLVDILDRVLDKGLVIAGDIKINLANVELLTIQIRLLICSIDKAEEIGLNWWRYDPAFSGSGDTKRLQAENEQLRERLHVLERRIERLVGPSGEGGEGESGGTGSKA